MSAQVLHDAVGVAARLLVALAVASPVAAGPRADGGPDRGRQGQRQRLARAGLVSANENVTDAACRVVQQTGGREARELES